MNSRAGYPYSGVGAAQRISGYSAGYVASTAFSLPTGFGSTYHLAITAYDSSYDGTTDIFDGKESWYSAEVSVYVPEDEPSGVAGAVGVCGKLIAVHRSRPG